MMTAFVLSLLLHGMAFLALFDLERTPAEARRATIVSAHLVPARAAQAPSTPSPPHAAPAAARSGQEEVRKQGREPPSAARKATTPSTAAAATATVGANAQARIARTTVRTPSDPPRLVDAPDNRADDSASTYLRLLAMRLAEVKQYPAAAVARREQGQALLSFRLDRSGRVLAWEIARSSGHDDLDAEVARMVARAAPFPPFPSAWSATSASFQVPIGFSLY